MNLAKYIIRGLLVAVACLFIGELYIWHISDFETKYSSMTFYLQKGDTQQQMLSDLEEAARKTEVGLCGGSRSGKQCGKWSRFMVQRVCSHLRTGL